jgi:hypothetical protein
MFEDLALHDASLIGVQFDWAAGTCTFEIAQSSSVDCELKFTHVSELIIPRLEPWGPSVSINSVRASSQNAFEIELQSGDVVRVQASSWAFSCREAKSAP